MNASWNWEMFFVVVKIGNFPFILVFLDYLKKKKYIYIYIFFDLKHNCVQNLVAFCHHQQEAAAGPTVSLASRPSPS